MENTTEFLNLQTDFGFKYIFGEERHKHILIRFLNALLGDKMHINDVVFRNKEKLPSDEDGKRILYDVYCTVPASGEESSFLSGYLDRDKARSRNHHFILEMQNLHIPPFKDRLTFYGSMVVAEQGKKGWNYDLEPVIVIAVVDFNLPNLSNTIIKDIKLMDGETHEVFSEKFNIIIASLPNVPDSWEKCRTEKDEILFLIKNMDRMDVNSIAYKEGRYKDMFEAARINTLNEDNAVRYSDSLTKLRDVQRGMVYHAHIASEEARAKALVEGRAQGIAEGRVQGIAEGRAEGEREEKIKTAKIMLSMNLPKDTILAVTRLSEEEFDQLL